MLLEPRDAEQFFRLHRSLLFFVNQRLKVVADQASSPEEFYDLPPEVRVEVRDALNSRLDLIESFADVNPFGFTCDELDIVRSWRHLVTGEFFAFRALKKYMVFLSTTDPSVAYGVLGLSKPLEDLIGPHLPVLAETVLLPFKGVIVYDGLISSFNISFGPGIRRGLNETFKKAKIRQGIVTSLPISDVPSPAKPRKA